MSLVERLAFAANSLYELTINFQLSPFLPAKGHPVNENIIDDATFMFYFPSCIGLTFNCQPVNSYETIIIVQYVAK